MTKAALCAWSTARLNSKLYVNAASGGSANQNAAAQVWKITEESSGFYSIKTSAGEALTVANANGTDGNDIYLSAYTGGSGQLFALYPNEDGTFAVLTAASDKKSGMDIYGISLNSGANICQWNYWGGAGQKFIIEPATPAPKGDVNMDGEITNADAALLLKYLCGNTQLSAESLEQAHVNDDGIVNMLDVIAILK